MKGWGEKVWTVLEIKRLEIQISHDEGTVSSENQNF